MKTKRIMELYNDYVMPTYTQTPIVFVKGDGLKVFDSEGNEYLDFFPGWAVSGLGHCHPRVVKAIKQQAGKMIHVPNNYMNELQAQLAFVIAKNSFDGKVFFANSGAEANEAAIKLARKYGNQRGGRFEIISMLKSFHGRTLATITMTGQDKVKIGFEPLPTGFLSVPFNDLEALKSAVTDKTAAVIVEPIQGEGGISVADEAYMRGLRRFCTEKDILLIFDEVQTGMGRTGKVFAYQHYDIEPDVMTLAKSLGGGVPIGAIVARRHIADTLGAGSHASTFGGSPIVCAAALAVFEAIDEEGLIDNVDKMGAYLVNSLKKLKSTNGTIKEIRGKGLMIGVELKIEGDPIVKECLKRGLLINCTQKKVLRLMPPLIVKKRDIDKAIKILNEVLNNTKVKP